MTGIGPVSLPIGAAWARAAIGLAARVGHGVAQSVCHGLGETMATVFELAQRHDHDVKVAAQRQALAETGQLSVALFEPGLAKGRPHQSQHGAQPLQRSARIVHGGGTIIGACQRAARDLDLLNSDAAHLVRQRGFQLETIRHAK